MEDQEAMVERFPDIIVTQQLLEVDRDRYTCSGGVAPLDLMTYLLTQPRAAANWPMRWPTC